MSARVRVGVARSVGVTRLPTQMVDAAVTLANLERFCRALSRNLGIQAEPVQTRGYAELMKGLDTRSLELAWLPPVVALHALRLGLASPLVAPLRGGSPTFHTALFARAGSTFQSENDLAGARVAWVDRASAAGYAVVRAALRASGHDLEHLFGSEAFHGSHKAVVQAVADGTADVGATYLHRDAHGTLLRAGWGAVEMQAVFEQGPIPADVLAAATRLDTELADRVAEELVVPPPSAARDAGCQLFEAEGFVHVDSSHLEPLSSLVAHFDDAPMI